MFKKGSRVTHSCKLAACVITYNPDISVADNITSYADSIDLLILVDNTDDGSSVDFLKGLKKPCTHLTILGNGINLGIAKALNIAAQTAIDAGYDYLLTMDQDSRADAEMLPAMKEFIAKHDCSDIGIISPSHKITNVGVCTDADCVTFVDEVMTSGNILNLDAYKKTGHFMEELFIDSVDTEYCFRLKKNGYRIALLNNAVLHHPLGNAKTISIPSFIRQRIYRHKNLYCTHHSPLRRYYITRNKLTIAGMYRDFIPGIRIRTYKYLVEALIKVLLFEKEKFKKMYYMLRGFRDYRQCRMGKYESNPT